LIAADSPERGAFQSAVRRRVVLPVTLRDYEREKFYHKINLPTQTTIIRKTDIHHIKAYDFFMDFLLRQFSQWRRVRAVQTMRKLWETYLQNWSPDWF
jgi:hypothetical protein